MKKIRIKPFTLEPFEVKQLLQRGAVDLIRIISPAPSMMTAPIRDSRGSSTWTSGYGIRSVFHTCPFQTEGSRFWVREYFSAWYDGCHWKQAGPSFRKANRLTNVYYRVGHPFPDDDQSWVRPSWMPQELSRATIRCKAIATKQKSHFTDASVRLGGHGSLALWKALVSHSDPFLQSIDDWFWIGRFELGDLKKPVTR